MTDRDIIIIGSGPAGQTAAIYAARAGYQPLLFEGVPSGGQLVITSEIENYPGFPDSLSGPELMQKMKDQAKKFGTESLMATVTRADLSAYPFAITADDKKEYTAKALILATGARARYLDLPSVHALMGRGVSACATCDGFFFKNKKVYVIGGGDTAAEEALFLTKFCREIILVHRRDALRADKYLQQKVLAHDKIKVAWDTVVEKVKDPARGKVESIVLKNVRTGAVREEAADGIFMAIGNTPATEIFKGQIDLDENGYIRVSPGTTLTSREGVFAAGDVMNPQFRQACIAAGTGCIAALQADHFLQLKS